MSAADPVIASSVVWSMNVHDQCGDVLPLTFKIFNCCLYTLNYNFNVNCAW